MVELNKSERFGDKEGQESTLEFIKAKKNQLEREIAELKKTGASAAELEKVRVDFSREVERIIAREEVDFQDFVEEKKPTAVLQSTGDIRTGVGSEAGEQTLAEKPKSLRTAKEIAMEKTTVDLLGQNKEESAAVPGGLPIAEKNKQEGKRSGRKKSLAELAGIESAGRPSVEQKNTPEYKKAQEYADRLRAKIADIIKPLKGKEADLFKTELEKLSQEFWFFCKDMAFNDMEEFDYQAKVEMMEQHFQKTLAEVDKLSAEYRGDKPANQAEEEKPNNYVSEKDEPEKVVLSGEEIAKLGEILSAGDILLIEGTRWKIKDINEDNIVTMRVVATTSKSGNKVGTEETMPLVELVAVCQKAGEISKVEGLAEQLDLEEGEIDDSEKAREVGDEKPEEIEIGPADVVEDKASETGEEHIGSEQPISADSVPEEVEDFGQEQLAALTADTISAAEGKIQETKEALIESKEKGEELDIILEIFKNKIEQILVDDELTFSQKKEEIENSDLELAAKLEVVKENIDKEEVSSADKGNEKESLDLDQARQKYFAALAQRRNFIDLKRRSFGIGKYDRKNEQEFNALKAEYEKALQEHQKNKLSEKKEELELTPETEEEIFKKLFDEYLRLLEDEENKIDTIAADNEKGQFQKFKEWWRRHSKARLVAGLGMLGVGAAASFTGLGAVAGGSLFGTGFALVRGATSGVGTYMTAEAQMDTRTKKFGQKGLIDDVSKMGILKGLNVFKRGKANREAINELVEKANKGENVFEKFNVEQLRQELARLRALSLDKGVKLSQAGRFGESQGELISLLQQAYYKKLRSEMPVDSGALDEENRPSEANTEIFNFLSDTIDKETASAQNELVSEVDKDRIKKAKRHAIAAGLGISAGLFIGSKTINKFDSTSASEGKTADTLKNIKALFDKDVPEEYPGIPSPFGAEESVDSLDSSELQDMAIDAEDSGQAAAETATADPSVAEEPKPVVFEKQIDSSQVKGSDSIWRSARDLFKTNAEALGYKGDMEDSEALSRWAESQTANAVAALNQEQGGNLADLVHDGDTVKIELIDGKPKLIFEASSGIEAGHLSDTNVSQMFEQTSFSEGVEHDLKIDPNTGDQYLEIKTEDGVYKVYDWDRDGRPDLISPDGSHQEMSSQELSEFLAEKNIVESSTSEAPDADEIVRQARLEKIEALISKGEGSYSSDLFAVAKEQGRLDELFRSILAKGENEQTSSFVRDYFQDNNLSDNKRDVFLFELKRVLSTEEIKSPEVTMDKMLASFDSHAAKDFDAMAERFGSGHDSELVTINVNGQYAIVKRIDAFGGAFAKGNESFYIDTNGDNKWDLKIKGVKAMKVIFDGKRSLLTK